MSDEKNYVVRRGAGAALPWTENKPPEPVETAEPEASQEEAGPLDNIRDPDALYKKFLEETEEASAERKKAAHDESEGNPLKDENDPERLYDLAFQSWDTREAPAEDSFFPPEADSTAFSDYVQDNIVEINRTTFRSLPELTRGEAGDFAVFLESFRADDITTAAEKSRNLILMARRGEDVSGALISAGLRQADHRRGLRNASTEPTEEE